MRAGLTQPMLKCTPMHTVAIDFVGPCPESSKGDVWILTMIDVFTRWTIAIPCPNRKATTVMRALYEHLFCVYGIPIRILSDRGKEFIDAGLITLCNWLGVSKIATTGYQPQANGHIERFHAYMNASITSLAAGDLLNWDLYLPAVLFSYRQSICESTGYSPYYLMFGREPTTPADLIIDREAELFDSQHAYAIVLAEALHKAYDYARVKQHEASFNNAKRRDVNRKETTYEVGDLVFYWLNKTSEKKIETDIGRVTIPSKWTSWWHGPYSIISKTSTNVYEISVDGTPTKANVNRLTPHECWSKDLDDTNEISWLDGPLSHVTRGAQFISQTRGPSAKIKIGTMVAWPQQPTKVAPLPFGVGKVISVTVNENDRQLLNCQWYGNSANKPRGTYRPCWYQKSTKQIYYSAARHHPTHVADTTDDWQTKVYADAVIIQGFTIKDDDRIGSEDLAKIIIIPTTTDPRH
jgi:transposase InsO family protein